MIDDFDEQIEKFWDKHEKRISAWYTMIPLHRRSDLRLFVRLLRCHKYLAAGHN